MLLAVISPFPLLLLQCTAVECQGQGVSVGAAVGSATVVTILAIMPLGVLIGCCGQWYIAQGRRRASDSGNGGSRREKKQDAVIYEEPESQPKVTALNLSENIAYGQVQGWRTTAILPLSGNTAYVQVQGQRTTAIPPTENTAYEYVQGQRN